MIIIVKMAAKNSNITYDMKERGDYRKFMLSLKGKLLVLLYLIQKAKHILMIIFEIGLKLSVFCFFVCMQSV